MVPPMRARRVHLLPLLPALLLAAAPVGCSRAPEGLYLGESCEIPWEVLHEAETQFEQGFPLEGEATRRWHLLEFGMGPAALLHHALPEASAEARARAEQAAARLAAAEDRLTVIRLLMAEAGVPHTEPVYLQPYPAALGARVAAQVAALEPGESSGPLRTLNGWEVVLLENRMDGPRNRATVLVYVVVYPVGDADDRRRATEAWATVSLSGSQEILDALPFEFRRGRVLETP